MEWMLIISKQTCEKVEKVEQCMEWMLIISKKMWEGREGGAVYEVDVDHINKKCEKVEKVEKVDKY